MSKLKINLEELTKDIDKVFNILDAVDLDDLDSKKIKNITKKEIKNKYKDLDTKE